MLSNQREVKLEFQNKNESAKGWEFKEYNLDLYGSKRKLQWQLETILNRTKMKMQGIKTRRKQLKQWLQRKFLALNAYIRKLESVKISDLILHFEKLEQQIKFEDNI